MLDTVVGNRRDGLPDNTRAKHNVFVTNDITAPRHRNAWPGYEHNREADGECPEKHRLQQGDVQKHAKDGYAGQRSQGNQRMLNLHAAYEVRMQLLPGEVLHTRQVLERDFRILEHRCSTWVNRALYGSYESRIPVV